MRWQASRRAGEAMAAASLGPAHMRCANLPHFIYMTFNAQHKADTSGLQNCFYIPCIHYIWMSSSVSGIFNICRTDEKMGHWAVDTLAWLQSCSCCKWICRLNSFFIIFSSVRNDMAWQGNIFWSFESQTKWDILVIPLLNKCCTWFHFVLGTIQFLERRK